MLYKLVISTFIVLFATVPVHSQPAQPSKTIPVDVQQTMNQNVAISDALTDEGIALAQADPSNPGNKPFTRYGITVQATPQNVGIPDSVIQDMKEHTSLQHEISNSELPQIGVPLNQLLQNQTDEALRTNKEFQQAIDQTQLLPTHYPTVYSGGAPDLQKIADQGDALSREVANRHRRQTIYTPIHH